MEYIVKTLHDMNNLIDMNIGDTCRVWGIFNRPYCCYEYDTTYKYTSSGWVKQ